MTQLPKLKELSFLVYGLGVSGKSVVNFFKRNNNQSIGNKISLAFAGNMPADYTTNQDHLIDKKKSGEYLIYAARHQFSGNFYNVNLTCAKLGNETMGTAVV